MRAGSLVGPYGTCGAVQAVPSAEIGKATGGSGRFRQREILGGRTAAQTRVSGQRGSVRKVMGEESDEDDIRGHESGMSITQTVTGPSATPKRETGDTNAAPSRRPRPID